MPEMRSAPIRPSELKSKVLVELRRLVEIACRHECLHFNARHFARRKVPPIVCARPFATMLRKHDMEVNDRAGTYGHSMGFFKISVTTSRTLLRDVN